jgi:hypothetical protein
MKLTYRALKKKIYAESQNLKKLEETDNIDFNAEIKALCEAEQETPKELIEEETQFGKFMNEICEQEKSVNEKQFVEDSPGKKYLKKFRHANPLHKVRFTK